jgi:PPM family protein phosphatase
VMHLSTGEASLSGMATTLVAVLVQGATVSIANIGDSRAYRCRQGQIEPLTVDDSWVEEQVRLGTLTRDEAERSPYRNAITRGIGIEDTISIEVSEVALEAGDVLLLCSDGLYRMVDEETMARVLTGNSPERAAYRLVDLANEAGGIDNISVAIYKHD